MTGVVTDSAGQPVVGAYVIGLHSLTVVQTDASGRYTMPCDDEPLVASTWIPPIVRTGAESIGPTSGNVTQYTTAPTTPGPGYTFSGGAPDADHAVAAACDGRDHDFALPPGASVTVTYLDANGNPINSQALSGPASVFANLYFPGLDEYAALYVPASTSTGTEQIDQIGGGTLRVDGTSSSWLCTGAPGISPSTPSGVESIPIPPGATVSVTCRETII